MTENNIFQKKRIINNYLSEKISLDFSTTGDVVSKLTGDLNTAKQTLNLNYMTSCSIRCINLRRSCSFY